MSDRSYNPTGGIYGQRGLLIRFAYLIGACVVWCGSIGGRLGRRRSIVLCYHGVTDAQRGGMRRHIEIARARAISSDQLFRAQPSRERGSVCFTFDDAFANLHTNMLPFASASAVPVCIYAVPGNLGRAPAWPMRDGHPERSERIMTDDELIAASRIAGCSIGSHTQHHKALATIDSREANDELTSSKMALEALLERPVDEIAAPYGSWSGDVTAMARSAGYSRLFTLDPSDTNESKGIIGRYLMTPDTSSLEFRLTIDGAYRWVFVLRRAIRAFRARAGSSFRSQPVSQPIGTST